MQSDTQPQLMEKHEPTIIPLDYDQAIIKLNKILKNLESLSKTSNPYDQCVLLSLQLALSSEITFLKKINFPEYITSPLPWDDRLNFPTIPSFLSDITKYALGPDLQNCSLVTILNSFSEWAYFQKDIIESKGLWSKLFHGTVGKFYNAVGSKEIELYLFLRTILTVEQNQLRCCQMIGAYSEYAHPDQLRDFFRLDRDTRTVEGKLVIFSNDMRLEPSKTLKVITSTIGIQAPLFDVLQMVDFIKSAG